MISLHPYHSSSTYNYLAHRAFAQNSVKSEAAQFALMAPQHLKQQKGETNVSLGIKITNENYSQHNLLYWAYPRIDQ